MKKIESYMKTEVIDVMKIEMIEKEKLITEETIEDVIVKERNNIKGKGAYKYRLL